MDFRHLIVTCLFSMLRLSFETQKIKENYAILTSKTFCFNSRKLLFRQAKPAWKSAQSIPNHLLFRLKTSDFPQKNAGIDLKKHGITCKKSLIVVP